MVSKNGNFCDGRGDACMAFAELRVDHTRHLVDCDSSDETFPGGSHGSRCGPEKAKADTRAMMASSIAAEGRGRHR